MTGVPHLQMLRTKAEWRNWVQQDHALPFQLPSRRDLQRMSPRDQALLKRERQGRNSASPIVTTKAMRHLMQRLRSHVRSSEHAAPTARRGAVIDAAPGVGKTTLLIALGKELELELMDLYPERFAAPTSRDEVSGDYCPVVYICTPARATPLTLSRTFADFMGVSYTSGANAEAVTSHVLRAMNYCGTQLVIVDEIHNLDMSVADGRLANDYLKRFMNECAGTMVYAGADLEKSTLWNAKNGELRDRQTSGRFTPYKMQPMSISTKEEATEWASTIKVFEEHMPLYDHEPGTLARTEWRYLHDRTSGHLGALTALLRMAVDESIETGEETLSRALLDEIPTDAFTQAAYIARTRPPRQAKAKDRRERTAAAS